MQFVEEQHHDGRESAPEFAIMGAHRRSQFSGGSEECLDYLARSLGRSSRDAFGRSAHDFERDQIRDGRIGE